MEWEDQFYNDRNEAVSNAAMRELIAMENSRANLPLYHAAADLGPDMFFRRAATLGFDVLADDFGVTDRGGLFWVEASAWPERFVFLWWRVYGVTVFMGQVRKMGTSVFLKRRRVCY